MQIGLKLGDNVWHEATQPWARVDAGAWRKCSKLSGKMGDNQWHEIWPGRIIYVHTGYGYGMSVAACFGYPTSPGNYIFYNNGVIGGVVGGNALTVGSFPAGSTVTIINQGRIQGIGGAGGYYNANRTGVLPTQGGTAFYCNYPCILDNTNGTIWGGGGGGGGSAEWGGSNDNNAPGAGGAGIPGGARGLLTWRPGWTYGSGGEPTDTAGGWTNFDGGSLLTMAVVQVLLVTVVPIRVVTSTLRRMAVLLVTGSLVLATCSSSSTLTALLAVVFRLKEVIVQNYTRIGGQWLTALSADKKTQYNVHLDTVRQEILNPLLDPIFVVSVSYFTSPAKDGVIPTAADLAKCIKYRLEDDDVEVVMIIDEKAGQNAALAFERIASVCADVVQGVHRTMGYKAYTAFQRGRPHTTPGALFIEDDRSPSGRIAVWDVTFTRTYGTDKNGLFAILTEEAKYRAGFMSPNETKPGSCYSLPANFWLHAKVTGTSYLEVLTNLLEYVKESSDLANTEGYRVK